MDLLPADFPVMSMPEGAINENNHLVFDEGNIRFTGEFFLVATVMQACMPQRFLQQLLWLGIPAFYFRHVEGPRLRGIEAVFLGELRDFYLWFRILFQTLKQMVD